MLGLDQLENQQLEVLVSPRHYLLAQKTLVHAVRVYEGAA
jgi:hypothetical protein